MGVLLSRCFRRRNNLGAPRKSHCKRGHAFTKENTYESLNTTGGRKPYLMRSCKTCKREVGRKRHADPEIRARRAEQSNARARERRKNGPKKLAGRTRREKEAWLATVKTKCARCDETDPVCLDFHHRDPANKTENIGWMMGKSFSVTQLQEEAAKCDVLCSNCHRKLHWSLRKAA